MLALERSRLAFETDALIREAQSNYLLSPSSFHGKPILVCSIGQGELICLFRLGMPQPNVFQPRQAPPLPQSNFRTHFSIHEQGGPALRHALAASTRAAGSPATSLPPTASPFFVSSFLQDAASPKPIVPKGFRLKFNSDLSEALKDWTPLEKRSGRRLVEFHRRVEDHVINCSITISDLQNLRPGAIVVSCIYYAERDEYYVTSVDCIYVLEQLLGIRFTIDDKNRIRRNLEGFKPLTISKSRTSTIAFFRQIMSFPNPKPRNIEKDVKVFPWSTLPNALRKIAAKYVRICIRTFVCVTNAGL